MLNFDYYNPTHIVFGQNRLAELDNLIPKNARVMLTFGGHSAKKYGTIDKIKAELKSREVIEFGGIEANPKYDTLVKAIEVAKAENIEFLLAVGGGSVMDATKFIALATKYGNEEYQNILLNGFAPVPAEAALPLGCVTTLPATGSEMNMSGVVTFNGQKFLFMSPLVFPRFSFLDPDLTLTLPQSQIANGVADAFVHVLEQYLTVPTKAMVQERTAEGILKTLIEIGPVTFNSNNDIDARKNFIWAATNALNGMIGAGVPKDWSTHMIGHELTSIFGIAHGRSLAIVLPSLLRERKTHKREKLIQFAERVWDITDGSDDEKIGLAIDKTEAFFNSLDIITKLSHYDINDEGIDRIIANLENLGMTALSESGDLTPDVVKKILNAAL
ncbi:iron-containing alcohol dehydrogenase [Vibrio alginolyticus]|uniref:iron-containing alcohol dehydrogenase n=1 Tax=Vibrio alginolyticus TaxID=663 RepID=UPI003D7D3C73